jgi:uncharacterized protein (TIGR02001 family)
VLSFYESFVFFCNVLFYFNKNNFGTYKAYLELPFVDFNFKLNGAFYMKKTTTLKTIVSAMLIAGSTSLAFVPAAAQASEVNANLGATSNYIWRGYTQDGNIPSLNGGLDYSLDSGVYLGTWAATTGSTGTGTNFEVDLYGGYAGSVKSLDYNLGYVYYAYPNQKDVDFSEVYASVGMAGATVGANMTVTESAPGSKTGDLYLFASYGTNVTEDWSVSGTYGVQSFAESGAKSYSHINLAAGYKDFTFAIDKAMGDGVPSGLKDSVNGKNSDPVLSVSYSKSFDL